MSYNSSSFSFPFSNISNAEFTDLFDYSLQNSYDDNSDLRKILTEALTDDITDSLEFKYYTPYQLNNLANKNKSTFQLTMYHVNVRSLNANYNKLVNFLQCLSFQFDVIILSEIWSTNIQYFANLFNEYDFFYQISNNRAGGFFNIYKKIT